MRSCRARLGINLKLIDNIPLLAYSSILRDIHLHKIISGCNDNLSYIYN